MAEISNRAFADYLNLLLPFTPNVWVAGLAMALAGCLAAHILSTRRHQKPNEPRSEALIFFGLIFGQSTLSVTSLTHYWKKIHESYSGAPPNSRSFSIYGPTSLKVLAGFWIFYVFFWEESYSCNLRANLISRRQEEAVDNLQDMVGFPTKCTMVS